MRTNTKRSGRHNKHRDISATERSTSNPVLLSRERKPKQAMCRSKLEDNRPNDLLQYAYRTYTLTAIVFRPPQNRCRTADNPALPLLSKRFRQCLLSCLILRLIAQTEAAVVDAAAVCFVFAVGTTGRGLLLWIYFHHRSSFCPLSVTQEIQHRRNTTVICFYIGKPLKSAAEIRFFIHKRLTHRQRQPLPAQIYTDS